MCPTWSLVAAFNLASIPILFVARWGPGSATGSHRHQFIIRTFIGLISFKQNIFHFIHRWMVGAGRWWAQDMARCKRRKHRRTLWRSRRWHKYLFLCWEAADQIYPTHYWATSKRTMAAQTQPNHNAHNGTEQTVKLASNGMCVCVPELWMATTNRH